MFLPRPQATVHSKPGHQKSQEANVQPWEGGVLGGETIKEGMVGIDLLDNVLGHAHGQSPQTKRVSVGGGRKIDGGKRDGAKHEIKTGADEGRADVSNDRKGFGDGLIRDWLTG